jgi:hypothetical protein
MGEMVLFDSIAWHIQYFTGDEYFVFRTKVASRDARERSATDARHAVAATWLSDHTHYFNECLHPFDCMLSAA